MERWNGKVAIVTGASSGIGAAIAEKLVDAGMKVVGLARRAERIEEQAKTLVGKPGKLYAFKTDMTVEAEIINAFNWTTANVGPVNVLVNNSGTITIASLSNGETEKWKRVLDTNVLGLCIATREAIQVMNYNKIDGHIVNINSVCGQRPTYFPMANMYCASKFAVTNLTSNLRQELTAESSGIKITSISPGVVDTEIFGLCPPGLRKSVIQMPKLKSADVANATIYVLGTPPSVQITELTIEPLGQTM